MSDVLAKSLGEGSDPWLLCACRQRNRQQKSNRRRALCSEIGQIHAQRLARDALRRICGKKMHAGDHPIGGQNQIATGGRRQRGRIVAKTERARSRGQGTEVARNEALFAGEAVAEFILVRRHFLPPPNRRRIQPHGADAPADREPHSPSRSLPGRQRRWPHRHIRK